MVDVEIISLTVVQPVTMASYTNFSFRLVDAGVYLDYIYDEQVMPGEHFPNLFWLCQDPSLHVPPHITLLKQQAFVRHLLYQRDRWLQ